MSFPSTISMSSRTYCVASSFIDDNFILFLESKYQSAFASLTFSYPISRVFFCSSAFTFRPCLWVVLLCATSVMALIAAISGFRCVPTPISSISGSFVLISSDDAPMVVTPTSVVRSFSLIFTPASSKCFSSFAGTDPSSSTMTSALVLLKDSAMDQASLSITSNSAWSMASSMVLPEAIPLVWNLNSWRSPSG